MMLEISPCITLKFFARKNKSVVFRIQCNPPPLRHILTKKLRKSQSFAQFFNYQMILSRSHAGISAVNREIYTRYICRCR